MYGRLCKIDSFEGCALVHNQMHLLAVFSIRECKHLTRLKTAIILKAIWQKNSRGRGGKALLDQLGGEGEDHIDDIEKYYVKMFFLWYF